MIITAAKMSTVVTGLLIEVLYILILSVLLYYVEFDSVYKFGLAYRNKAVTFIYFIADEFYHIVETLSGLHKYSLGLAIFLEINIALIGSYQLENSLIGYNDGLRLTERK
jgi:hypothetical protein